MKNLKNKKYYEDIYDKITVEQCRKKEKSLFEVIKELRNKSEAEKLDELDTRKAESMFFHLSMHIETAYRYKDRDQFIQKMMDKDRSKDERIESAEAPLVNCLKCKSELIPKHVDAEINNKILYMYDCPKGCIPRRAFYDDGTEHVIKDKKCPECDSDIDEEVDKTKGKFLLIDKCPNCDYKKIWDYSSKEEKEDSEFEKDKKRFCLDKEAGMEAMESLSRMDSMAEFMDEMKEKDKRKDLYDSIKNLPKLSIHELKKRLDVLLEENNYSDLIFSQPQISTDIQVSFTAYETRSDRKDYDSRQNLKNLLKKDLLNTNWRLMSDGVEYRMGVLSGRLRGYDKEADLLKLEEQKIKNAKK